MTYRFIYGFIPVPIFFTNCFIPKRFHAVSLGLFVLIRPDKKDNEPLIEHELQHCRQCWRTLWIHGVIYFTSKRYRFYSEVDAFAQQIKVGGSYQNAVHNIKHNYKLDVREKEIEDALNERLL